MKFLKKKNLMEGEDIVYIPQLHWIYSLKPLIYSLPFFLLLSILWVMDKPCIRMEYTQIFNDSIRTIFISGLLVILLIFVYRIFLYLVCEYGITNKRLLIKKGIVRATTAEISTDRIESVYGVQGIMGRIFDYGTIAISGIGGRTLVFGTVYRPNALRRRIVAIIEKNKAITVVHGEIQPAALQQNAAETQEPIYRYGTFVRVLPDSVNK